MQHKSKTLLKRLVLQMISILQANCSRSTVDHLYSMSSHHDPNLFGREFQSRAM